MRKRFERVLKNILRFSKEHGGMWNIPPETGLFLYQLVKVSHARRILEVGMSNGYSTLWLAEAIRFNGGGRIFTIERDPLKVNLARVNFKKAGVSRWVDIRYGEALEILKKLRGPFDFVFIDATKEEYLDYLKLVLPKTKKRTLIVADNAIMFKDRMKDYLHFVRNHPQLESVLVPIGSGEEMTLRK